MRNRRVLLILVSVLFAGALLAIYLLRTKRQQTLGGYVEELQAKGERMTFQELIASLSPNTNNSLAVLTNVVLQLGVPPPGASNIDLLHFVSPGRAQVAWSLREPTWAVPSAGSPSATWAQVGDRVTAMASLLGQLHQAMKRPAPNAGVRTN